MTGKATSKLFSSKPYVMGKLLKNLTFKAKDPHKAFCKISIIITTKLLLEVYALLKRYNYNFSITQNSKSTKC